MILQNKKIVLSVVLPCLNEEEAIPVCLDSLRDVLQKDDFSAEVIVVDNDSTDASATILNQYKKNNPDFPLIIVEERTRGYGSAYQKGFSVAQGDYIFMADLDGTYDFNDIPRFMDKINKGYDLIVGNRFLNNKKIGSMPWHHRYIGNPILSGIVRLFFGIKIKDIHCGARMIKNLSLQELSLTTRGMEFASEMIIKAAKENIPMTEIPIKYDDRIGDSKLHSFKDGWRHLRFIFLYSPLIIFLIPGLCLLSIGLISMIILYTSNPSFFNVTFYVHPMFFSAVCIITGYQLIYFSFFAKIYAIIHLKERSKIFEKIFKHITLERACLAGLLLLICGVSIFTAIAYGWIYSGFDSLNETKSFIVALTLLIVGVQTISSAFMLSIISIKS